MLGTMTNEAPARLRAWLRGLALGLGVLALAAALVGCGSDDEASDVAAATRGEAGGAEGFGGVPAMGGGTTDSMAADGDDGAMAEEERAQASARAPSAPGADLALSQVETLGRTIIRTGSLSLEVESVASAFDAVRAAATARGGFVAESSFSGSGEEASAQLTLRVPAERVDDLISDLRGLAVEVASVQTGTQDVTEQVIDLEARLRNLRAVETRYTELLGDASDIGEVLLVQERLTETRYEIERTEGRLQALQDMAALATLSVQLFEDAPPMAGVTEGTSPLDAAREAWGASLDTLNVLASAAVAAVVYSWWLLPLVPVLWWLGRRAWRARPQRAGGVVPSVDTPGGAS